MAPPPFLRLFYFIYRKYLLDASFAVPYMIIKENNCRHRQLEAESICNKILVPNRIFFIKSLFKLRVHLPSNNIFLFLESLRATKRNSYFHKIAMMLPLNLLQFVFEKTPKNNYFTLAFLKLMFYLEIHCLIISRLLIQHLYLWVNKKRITICNNCNGVSTEMISFSFRKKTKE